MPYQFQLPPQVDSTEFKAYLEGIDSKNFKDIRHSGYVGAVDHALCMAVHAVEDRGMENHKSQELVHNLRPNEIQEAFDYRVANYRQVTLAAWNKILNTLYNIFNPRLTAVHFPEMPRSITEPFEQYYQDEMLTAWIEKIAFPTAMRDANAVVAILQRDDSMGEDQYPEPVPVLFESKNVIDFRKGKYYLLEKHLSEHMIAGNMTGRVFYWIDSEKYVTIIEIKQDRKTDYVPEDPVFHDCGSPPVVHCPGDPIFKDHYKMLLSYLYGVLPNWDEALVVKSDYQAVRTRNAHPKMWQFKIKCPKCKGEGSMMNAAKLGGKRATCGACNGSGLMKAQGPGDVMILDAKAFDGNAPKEPGGYIESNVSLIQYLRDDVQKEINEGYAAVNMDHLSKDTNIQESGEAKKVGRTDLNTFMDKVASGVYRMWGEIVYFIGCIRYKTRIGSDWKQYLPIIEKPKQYDVLSPEEYAAAVKMAKDAGLSYAIIAKSELDYTRKTYGEDAEVYKRLKAKLEVDPLPGLAAQDSIQIESDTRQIDRWVHFNIDRFINRAIAENENFHALPAAQKRAIVYAFAEPELQSAPRIPSPEE